MVLVPGTIVGEGVGVRLTVGVAVGVTETAVPIVTVKLCTDPRMSAALTPAPAVATFESVVGVKLLPPAVQLLPPQ